jgi:hypothetical protein
VLRRVGSGNFLGTKPSGKPPERVCTPKRQRDRAEQSNVDEPVAGEPPGRQVEGCDHRDRDDHQQHMTRVAIEAVGELDAFGVTRI